MEKKYIIRLKNEEKKVICGLIESKNTPGKIAKKAQVLLKADYNTENHWPDAKISKNLGISQRTIFRIRRKFTEEGLDAALYRKKNSATKKGKLDSKGITYLKSIISNPPPKGQSRWTLRSLANHMVQRGYVDYISHETIRQTLLKFFKISSPTEL